VDGLGQGVIDTIGAFVPGYVLPLVLAVAFGAAVGLERETWKKPAGLRTHMMVALGSAIFTLLSLQEIVEGKASGIEGGDPSRAIVGVATGLGFIGAGTIIQHRGKVLGMTTASGIWVVGGIGACCGARQYLVAAVGMVLALIILAILGKLEAAAERANEGTSSTQKSEGSKTERPPGL
jgi:putative Mg2+ transporter-C (MgtC) family protein